MVQNYVSRLRKALAGDGGAVIVTRGRGYELRIDRERSTPAASSGSSPRRPRAERRAGDAAREALALFRGEPLADLADEPFAGAEIRRLEELRLTAAELAIEADLAAGRHEEVVGELDALVAEHPLRERLHAQRMLALYRCGRQAEALEAYRDARRDAGRGDRRRAGPGAAAPARGDPAPGPRARRRAGRGRAAAELDAAAAPPMVGRDARAAMAAGALAPRRGGRRRAGDARRARTGWARRGWRRSSPATPIARARP